MTLSQTCGGSGEIQVGKTVPWGGGVWDLCPGCTDCRVPPPVSVLPERLRGDGPCADCGTLDNICWFTENVLWNEVVRAQDEGTEASGVLCIPCFIKRVDAAGLAPTGWRLLPDWHWETREEYDRRRAGLYEEEEKP